MSNNYIKVNVKTLNADDVCSIYNSNKKENMLTLEKLDRAEGGFKISLPNKQDLRLDANEKCKQLRWYRGFLKPYNGYQGFDREELDLLYDSLKENIGEENIEWHEKIMVK